MINRAAPGATHLRRRAVLRLAMSGSLVALLGLQACGFRPLHRQSNSGPAAAPEMAGIGVALIPERSGQILRQYLIEAVTPRGAPRTPRYRLDVKLTEQVNDRSFRQDATGSRRFYTARVEFTLAEIGVGTVLVNSGETSQISYDIGLTTEAAYATLAAQDDARDRALREIARAVSLRIAAHFARGRTS